MLGDGRRHEQEEQPRRNAVNRAVRDSRRMPAKNHDRPIHQAHQRIPRVGQRDAVADPGAVQFFPLLQRPPQRLPCFRVPGHLRNLVDQFAQHRVPVPTLQIQIHGRRGQQIT
jgi:hypothetical protein